MKLRVNEIFKSIQGESTYAGLPCSFIRLTGCNLRCSYCDTTYAFEKGIDMSIEEILADMGLLGCNLVEITGGEPLLQEGTGGLVKSLLGEGYKVLVETNGSLDIDVLPEGTIRIVDVKCPGSGMSERMDWKNMERLRPTDEVKFVLSSQEDYTWARGIIDKYALLDKSKVLMGVAYGKLDPRPLAEWILQDGLEVRLQLQLHRYIWPPGTQEGTLLRGTCRHEKGVSRSTP
ncbi:MAG TPA: radical SAM protein [Candidatus Brocadiales bacterium]|nr:radical SAM protein [Candidatus Brocadiales bacterium]